MRQETRRKRRGDALLPQLEKLFLNQIGDAGVAALAEAAGKLPQLKTTLAQIQPQHLPASQGRPQGRPAQLFVCVCVCVFVCVCVCARRALR